MNPPSKASNADDFTRANSVLVGGVNSAVRAFRAVGGVPRFIASGRGAYLWDVEGRRYIDYLGSWGAAIVGHAHPYVVEAVTRAARDGLSFGAPTRRETELAERITQIYPQVERVRFVSSGTEATMSALRLARGYTKRRCVLKFEGCYHGATDSLLVRAGSGALCLGTPSSAGVPEGVAHDTLVATFNDISSVEALFAEKGHQIACVMVEPVAGNMNLVLPTPGFLARLREICSEYGALLIFDEVMSGFRVSLQGAQGYVGVIPDLSTFGKVIGGGMPVGAIGGPAKIMEHFSPLGEVYQAGTLSGNPVAMAAGLATLDLVCEPGFFENLSARLSRLVDSFSTQAKRAGLAACAQSLGGMGGIYFLSSPPSYFRQTMEQNIPLFQRFFHAMLDRGVYFPPSPFEAFFASSALTDADIDETCSVLQEVWPKVG